MNLIDLRKGELLGYQWILDLSGVRRLEPIYKQRPFKELTVGSTLNTTVTCRVCMGEGKYLNQSQSNNSISKESLCGHCGGSGKMISV